MLQANKRNFGNRMDSASHRYRDSLKTPKRQESYLLALPKHDELMQCPSTT